MKEKFNISRIAINFPTQVAAIWLSIIIAGIFAFSSLKYALFPDISYPVLVVNAEQSDFSSTLKTESLLTDSLEKTLLQLPNIKDIYSTTYPSHTSIDIIYKPGTALEAASKEVKNILNKFPQFKLQVYAIDLNESPVITYAVTSEKLSLDQLSKINKKDLIPVLENIAGVLKVNLLGDSTIENTDEKIQRSLLPKFPTLVHFQGKSALALEIVKMSNANTLEVVRRVQEQIKALENNYNDLHFYLAETQAKYIQEATGATIEELFLAIGLAIFVIFVFLRTVKSTLISALAIPTSLLGTFIVMAIFHFNLETLTLLALTMVIGIVVDDAIVDVENITRLIEEGQDSRSAVINGTNEIGLSIVASTLTIVAVFLPVGLMAGSVGKFFKPFGLTISAAVLFSLLVARTLTPVLSLWWLKPSQKGTSVILGPNSSLVKLYQRVLYWSLGHRKTVMALALASLLIGIAFIPFIPKGFVPKLDRGEFNVVYTTSLPRINLNSDAKEKSSNSTFSWMDDLAKSPESFLLKRTMYVGKKLESTILKSSDIDSAFTIAGNRGELNQGKIYVRMKSGRSRNTEQMQDYIRDQLPQLKGVTVSVEDIPFVQTEAEKPLQMSIQGKDLPTLLSWSQKLKEQVASLSGFLDVELSNTNTDVNNLLKIEHINTKRMVYLSANLANSLALEDGASKIENLAKNIFPPDIHLERWGNSADSSDVLTSFAVTITISTILMLLVLFLLFGRLLEPIVIGLSLPLAIVGAMFGLWITHSDFGIISLLGLIFLLGLLSKNSILILDYIKRLRAQGMTRQEAVLESGKVRLRPIIMTTAATILGMIPITLGLGAGEELRQPMAAAIVGGLITSTALSLIVVPVLYTLIEDYWLSGKYKKKL